MSGEQDTLEKLRRGSRAFSGGHTHRLQRHTAIEACVLPMDDVCRRAREQLKAFQEAHSSDRKVRCAAHSTGATHFVIYSRGGNSAATTASPEWNVPARQPNTSRRRPLRHTL